MHRIALLIAPTVLAVAADGAVTITVKPMTFPVERSALGEAARGGTVDGTGYYPIRDPATKQPKYVREDKTVEVVVLDNGLVEAWVVPAWSGRLIRAIDKQTKTDYFWRLMKDGVWIADDHLAWNPGGVKPSFPFFEHGTGLDVPGGWRTVTAADGSATVAVDVRFTGNIRPGDLDRYGRYGDEALSIQVTLRPGSTVVEWAQRKDNNNPTPRSDRMWNDSSFPLPVILKTVTSVDKKTGKEVTKQVQDTDAVDRVFSFTYPCRWVVDHGPNNVHTSPHWSALTNWNVSHFAIDAPFGFSGGYYQEGDLNRLRINDTAAGKGPGVKLWTAPGPDLFEIWGGESWVFEYPGELQPAYKPTGFRHRYWLAQGIGPVAMANDDIAVGVSGTTFKLVASRNRTVAVKDGSGAAVGAGATGPHAVLAGTFDGKRLIVTAENGTILLDQAFPLDRPVPAKDTPVPAAQQAMFEKLKAGAQPTGDRFYEKQTYGRNQGQPALVNAMDVIPRHVTAGPQTGSLARVAYRLGEIEQAERLAKLAGGAEGDLVLGLIAAERGEATTFGAAGWEADYLRALAAKKAGDTTKAIALAKSYLTQVPDAWYPRLAVAWWSADVAAAQALAAENPASPEAQLVLQLLKQPAAVDDCLRGRPDAAEHLAIFRAQIEQGVYRPLPRFPVDVLRKRGW
jgi:hypothetical protein